MKKVMQCYTLAWWWLENYKGVILVGVLGVDRTMITNGIGWLSGYPFFYGRAFVY